MKGPRKRWAVFGNPGFPSYMAAQFLTGFAVQIQTVAVGWQVYDLTRDPFDLGLVGLSQFAPALLLVLVTGAVADRFPRRVTMGACLGVKALAGGGLLWLAATGNTRTLPIFALLGLFGAARAFYNPARQAMVPNLVVPEHLTRALATIGSVNKVATISGPLAGGLLYGLGAPAAYGVSLAFFLAAAALIAGLPAVPQRLAAGRRGWSEILAGVRFIRCKRIILGAISLDLFVVLLGGAVALLPVYARDVLAIGAVGLGLLRAAPAAGA
ncbi:MAG: MFS transporter, partial [Inquilinus sp.]|nr:MFS transporter [Inquilinus sp.]